MPSKSNHIHLLITSLHLSTPFHPSVLQGIDAIRDVIYHLETFDTTTIRASTPMFLMSRKIKVSHLVILDARTRQVGV